MTNLARFEIEGSVGGLSPSTDLGYDGVHEEDLTLRLEGDVASVARTWEVQVYSPDNSLGPRASKDAPLLTLVGATSGQNVSATSPGSDITTALPASGTHAWVMRSLVDDGNDSDGNPDPDRVFERMVVIRNTDGHRKIIAIESTQYQKEGWSEAHNEIVDTFETVGSAAVVSASGNKTITIDDWGKKDPATTPLYVLCTGETKLTYPSDDALVNGARIIPIKTNTSSYAVNVELTTGQIQLRSGPSFGSIGIHELYNGGGRIVCGDHTYAGAWLSNGIIPRTGGYVRPAQLEVSTANSLLGAGAVGGASLITALLSNRVMSQDQNGVFGFNAPNLHRYIGGGITTHVAPQDADAVFDSALADGGTLTCDITPTDGELLRIFYYIRVGEYALDYIVIAYDESGPTDPVIQLEKAAIAASEYSSPPSVTIAASIFDDAGTKKVRLSVTQNTGGATSVRIAPVVATETAA